MPQVHEEPLGGEVIPRSVLFSSLQGQPYLMCGMGDGSLLLWRAEEAARGSITERKKVRGSWRLGAGTAEQGLLLVLMAIALPGIPGAHLLL